MSMFPLNPLQRLTPRKIAKTGQVNRVIDAFNSLHPPDVSGIVDVPAHPQGQILAVIWDAGPAAEADYTATSGGRYWVRASTISAGNPRDAITLNNVGLTGSSGSDDGIYLFTATNDAEIPSGVPRHKLKKNTPVTVRVEVDAGGVPRWLFSYPIPIGLFPVFLEKVGGSNGTDTDPCSFTYDVADVNGQPLGSAMAPLTARVAAGMVDPDGAEHGEGFYNPSGTFILWRVHEVFLTSPDCDPAP
jgi:hypothetical protein